MHKIAILAVVTVPLFVLGGTSVASASAPASARYAGSWKGHTGQGKVIKFHVTSRNKINAMTFTIKIPVPSCGSTVTETDHLTFKRPIAIRNARFRIHEPGLNPVTVTGHFLSATKATGHLTATTSDPVTGCTGTKRTSWIARKRA